MAAIYTTHVAQCKNERRMQMQIQIQLQIQLQRLSCWLEGNEYSGFAYFMYLCISRVSRELLKAKRELWARGNKCRINMPLGSCVKMNEHHLHTSSETSVICKQAAHLTHIQTYIYIYIYNISTHKYVHIHVLYNIYIYLHKAHQIIKHANF